MKKHSVNTKKQNKDGTKARTKNKQSKKTKNTSKKTKEQNIVSFDHYELIVAEKPKAAYKIALALADSGTLNKKSYGGVPYYELKVLGKPVVVASAVGHLYTLMEKGGNKWKYPVLDIEWVPTFKAQKNASYVKKYIELLRKLSNKASEVTIATDYDIEGEVIGLNALRFAIGKKDAFRMKFSTLTPSELKLAYKNKMKSIDWAQARAGETRHILDYYYGINVSRALTTSLKTAGTFKVLSSGRIQGPTLKIIVDREEEINNFIPKKYWQLVLIAKNKNGETIEATHKQGNFWDKEKALKSKEKAESGIPTVESIKISKSKIQPPVPFDLTTLQTEAYRYFRITPKRTLEIAQNLYIEGLISYPRTSSQKLPSRIGFRNILKKISEQEPYRELATRLLNKSKLEPREGKKTDPAHPAIYPTGFAPKKLDAEHKKIYDLVVKRFLSVFAEPADKQVISVLIKSNNEPFVTEGVKITFLGWIDFYKPYYRMKEKEISELSEGEKLLLVKVNILEKETKPKPRYNQASLISELTKRNLGTKATRAQIIDTLFKRGYLKGTQIKPTELGIATIETLAKYSPTLLDEKLTRHFEEELESIRKNEKKQEEVLEEAKKVIQRIVEDFKKNEKSIGNDLKQAHKETMDNARVIGKCPNCKIGDLIVIKSKKTGKQFIACNRYPECKTTFSLPQYGLVKPAHENCPHCGWPMVIVIRKGKKPWKLCFNPNCPGKNNNTNNTKRI